MIGQCIYTAKVGLSLKNLDKNAPAAGLDWTWTEKGLKKDSKND